MRHARDADAHIRICIENKVCIISFVQTFILIFVVCLDPGG